MGRGRKCIDSPRSKKKQPLCESKVSGLKNFKSGRRNVKSGKSTSNMEPIGKNDMNAKRNFSEELPSLTSGEVKQSNVRRETKKSHIKNNEVESIKCTTQRPHIHKIKKAENPKSSTIPVSVADVAECKPKYVRGERNSRRQFFGRAGKEDGYSEDAYRQETESAVKFLEETWNKGRDCMKTESCYDFLTDIKVQEKKLELQEEQNAVGNEGKEQVSLETMSEELNERKFTAKDKVKECVVNKSENSNDFRPKTYDNFDYFASHKTNGESLESWMARVKSSEANSFEERSSTKENTSPHVSPIFDDNHHKKNKFLLFEQFNDPFSISDHKFTTFEDRNETKAAIENLKKSEKSEIEANENLFDWTSMTKRTKLDSDACKVHPNEISQSEKIPLKSYSASVIEISTDQNLHFTSGKEDTFEERNNSTNGNSSNSSLQFETMIKTKVPNLDINSSSSQNLIIKSDGSSIEKQNCDSHLQGVKYHDTLSKEIKEEKQNAEFVLLNKVDEKIISGKDSSQNISNFSDPTKLSDENFDSHIYINETTELVPKTKNNAMWCQPDNADSFFKENLSSFLVDEVKSDSSMGGKTPLNEINDVDNSELTTFEDFSPLTSTVENEKDETNMSLKLFDDIIESELWGVKCQESPQEFKIDVIKQEIKQENIKQESKPIEREKILVDVMTDQMDQESCPKIKVISSNEKDETKTPLKLFEDITESDRNVIRYVKDQESPQELKTDVVKQENVKQESKPIEREKTLVDVLTDQMDQESCPKIKVISSIEKDETKMSLKLFEDITESDPRYVKDQESPQEFKTDVVKQESKPIEREKILVDVMTIQMEQESCPKIKVISPNEKDETKMSFKLFEYITESDRRYVKDQESPQEFKTDVVKQENIKQESKPIEREKTLVDVMTDQMKQESCPKIKVISPNQFVPESPAAFLSPIDEEFYNTEQGKSHECYPNISHEVKKTISNEVVVPNSSEDTKITLLQDETLYHKQTELSTFDNCVKKCAKIKKEVNNRVAQIGSTVSFNNTLLQNGGLNPSFNQETSGGKISSDTDKRLKIVNDQHQMKNDLRVQPGLSRNLKQAQQLTNQSDNQMQQEGVSSEWNTNEIVDLKTEEDQFVSDAKIKPADKQIATQPNQCNTKKAMQFYWALSEKLDNVVQSKSEHGTPVPQTIFSDESKCTEDDLNPFLSALRTLCDSEECFRDSILYSDDQQVNKEIKTLDDCRSTKNDAREVKDTFSPLGNILCEESRNFTVSRADDTISNEIPFPEFSASNTASPKSLPTMLPLPVGEIFSDEPSTKKINHCQKQVENSKRKQTVLHNVFHNQNCTSSANDLQFNRTSYNPHSAESFSEVQLLPKQVSCLSNLTLYESNILKNNYCEGYPSDDQNLPNVECNNANRHEISLQKSNAITKIPTVSTKSYHEMNDCVVPHTQNSTEVYPNNNTAINYNTGYAINKNYDNLKDSNFRTINFPVLHSIISDKVHCHNSSSPTCMPYKDETLKNINSVSKETYFNGQNFNYVKDTFTETQNLKNAFDSHGRQVITATRHWSGGRLINNTVNNRSENSYNKRNIFPSYQANVFDHSVSNNFLPKNQIALNNNLDSSPSLSRHKRPKVQNQVFPLRIPPKESAPKSEMSKIKSKLPSNLPHKRGRAKPAGKNKQLNAVVKNEYGHLNKNKTIPCKSSRKCSVRILEKLRKLSLLNRNEKQLHVAIKPKTSVYNLLDKVQNVNSSKLPTNESSEKEKILIRAATLNFKLDDFESEKIVIKKSEKKQHLGKPNELVISKGQTDDSFKIKNIVSSILELNTFGSSLPKLHLLIPKPLTDPKTIAASNLETNYKGDLKINDKIAASKTVVHDFHKNSCTLLSQELPVQYMKTPSMSSIEETGSTCEIRNKSLESTSDFEESSSELPPIFSLEYSEKLVEKNDADVPLNGETGHLCPETRDDSSKLRTVFKSVAEDATSQVLSTSSIADTVLSSNDCCSPEIKNETLSSATSTMDIELNSDLSVKLVVESESISDAETILLTNGESWDSNDLSYKDPNSKVDLASKNITWEQFPALSVESLTQAVAPCSGADVSCSHDNNASISKETISSKAKRASSTYYQHETKKPRVLSERNAFSKSSFVCDFCDKKYVKEWYFMKHLRSHTKVRIHLCRVCGDGFTKKSDLVSHRLCHTNKEIYTCPVCKRNYIRKYNFLKHIKSHLVMMVYLCRSCDMAFIERSERTFHVKHLHTYK